MGVTQSDMRRVSGVSGQMRSVTVSAQNMHNPDTTTTGLYRQRNNNK